jgi:hypothetical protein
MGDSEFSSGTFILPPKSDHEGLLEELREVSLKLSTQIRGVQMSAEEANSILTLYHGLDEDMRDRLMARTIPDILAMTLRCQALSSRDQSWSMFKTGGVDHG